MAWTYPEHVEAFRKYPEIAVIDTTGKDAITCIPWSTLLCTTFSPGRTNNKALPLFVLSGVDGNYKTFIALNALLYDETAESFLWVFECAAEFFGADVCAAVHVLISDDDVAITSAFERQVCTWFVCIFLVAECQFCTYHRLCSRVLSTFCVPGTSCST